MSKRANLLRWAFANTFLLAAVTNPASAGIPKKTPRDSQQISVRVYDYGHLSGPLMEAAEGEAAEILIQAGVEANWIACPTSKEEEPNFPDCPSHWRAEDFVLRLVPHAMPEMHATGQDTLGYAIECDGAVTCPASVFYDRVSALAEGGSATLPVLLGRAMAHELGHLLLGSHSHSRTGIMRALWSGRDLTLEGRPYLLFTADESRRMTARLHQRAQVWQAQSKVEDLARE